MNSGKAKLLTLAIIIVVVLAMFHDVLAYQLSVPFIDTKTGQPTVTSVTSPADYVRTIYRFALGAGALLAILMVVIGGIRVTISEAVPSREAAMEQIRSAILGLVLLLASYLILTTINPQLNIQTIQDPAISPVSIQPKSPVVRLPKAPSTLNKTSGILTWAFNNTPEYRLRGFIFKYNEGGSEKTFYVTGDANQRNLDIGLYNSELLKKVRVGNVSETDIRVEPILDPIFVSNDAGIKNFSFDGNSILSWDKKETGLVVSVGLEIKSGGVFTYSAGIMPVYEEGGKSYIKILSPYIIEGIRSGKYDQIKIVPNRGN